MNCDTWFPNPIEQAMALLSNCNDNIEAARGLARAQALCADHADNNSSFWWWIAVRDSLIPERSAQC